MNIFGYGGRPKGKWDSPSSNKWQIEGQTVDEYVQAQIDSGSEESVFALRDQFWAARKAAIEESRQELEGMSPSGSASIPLYNTDTQNAAAVTQVQGAAEQWEKLSRITSGKPIGKTGVVGGTVVGYDIETFGDMSYGKPGEFGITEFGIGITEFREGGLFTESGHALAIGINEEQAAYLNSVLTKYQEQGWNALSRSERVSMERASMYAGTGPNFRSVYSQITEEGDFKGMWEVKKDKLLAPDMSVERIRKGIENWQAVYRAGATSESVLPKAMDYLQTMHGKGTASKGAILAASNSVFDIPGLRRFLGEEYDGFLKMMQRNTVDLANGVRALADVRYTSVAELQKVAHGTRGGGASVQAILASLQLNEIETHWSLGDIHQQNRLLAAQDFMGGKTLSQNITKYLQAGNKNKKILTDVKGKELVKRYDAKNTLFLLNRGWLDKRNGTDFALINTGDGLEATQNYTISGEYWALDEAHTGQVEDGFRLSMVSSADGTLISKRFATRDQAVSFLMENADWYDKSEVLDASGDNEAKYIEHQRQFKYQDRGRRAFERALDPAEVAVDGNKPANGFAAMEEFLQWNREYGDKYTATPDGFNAFVADMKKRPEGFNINIANNMQDFLGAQAKISDEKDLLQMIVDQVNQKYGQKTTVTNNMQKTIALRKAYEDAMDFMSSQGKLQHADEHRNLVMSDIFGVDVRLPDGKISRINAHTTHTATKDVNRIFSKLTKDEAVGVIEDLVSRQVISKKQGAEFASLLKEVSIEAGGDKAKKDAIERYLSTESSYQLYTDIGYALSKRTSVFRQSSRDAEPKSFEAKRAAKERPKPEFTLADSALDVSDSLSARMQEYMHKRYVTANGLQSVNDFAQHDKSVAQQVIQKSLQGLPQMPIYDGYGKSADAFKANLAALSNSLGYGSDIITPSVGANGEIYEHNLLEDMFFKTDKGYSIASRPGVHSVIVRPDDNGSAFMLLSNNQHYGRLMEELSKVQAADIASFSAITDSSLAQHATIYELPQLHRYTVGEYTSDAIKMLMGNGVAGKQEAELIALRQSENAEKFLISRLHADVYEASDGKMKMHAYINNGVYDYLSSFRMRGSLALDKTEASEFQDATRYLRQQQNQKVEDLSSSASYRGFWETDPVTGKRRIVRKPNYTPADYMYAYRMRMTEGLHSIFKHGLSDMNGGDRNDLDVLVDAYGEAFGVYRGRRSLQKYRQDIADSTYFKEFFNKNLFLGTIGDTNDPVVSSIRSVRDKNIFTLLRETVNRDTANIFDKSVKDALDRIKAVADEDDIFQVLSASAMEHGDVSLGVATGEYNVNAFLYSTMRPTYMQQNLGRLFNAKTEWNDSDFKGDFLRTVAGSPERTAKEYAGLSKVNFFDGYADQVRHVMTGFKQMNDNDLQLKYAFMEANASKLASEVGISAGTYEKIRKYMREDMMSLHEGKWFLDPRIAQQGIVSTPDAKKVKLIDVKRADAQRSGEALQALVDNNALITANTIVGYDSTGEALFAGKDFRAYLDDVNMEDIFDIQVSEGKKLYSFKNGATGFTRIIPETPDISDPKLMINGAEKATGHAINIDSFMEYLKKNNITEITDKATATNVLSKMFHQISDGANVIGYLNLQKHGNLMGLDSPWRIITTEYVARGQGQLLVNYLNDQLAHYAKEKNNPYAGIKEFRLINGEIISDTSRAVNPAAFLLNVTNDILNDVNKNTETNAAIRNIVEYTKKHGITYGALEFMNQNEHVSDGIFMDKRIEQGIRQRAYAMRNGEHWDQQWADELVNFAENYTGARQKGGTQYENLNSIFSFWNQKISFNKVESRNKRYNMEKSLHGIVESLVFYEDPEAFNVASKNILKLDFQKLMSSGIVPKNGTSVSALQSSLFFTDGRPSEALQKLAAEQHVDFGPVRSSFSNSLYIDLGAYSIKSRDGKQTMHGFLLPIQNVITDADETMFQTQQSNTASMLSRIQNLIENPGTKSTDAINAELTKIVREYYQASMKQLAVADKNSDYYKAIQRHFMPNSGGLLAEQELAPLIYNPDNDAKLQSLLKERNELEFAISNRRYGTDANRADMARLDSIYDQLKEIHEQTANKILKNIEEGKDQLSFTQLKGTKLEGLTKEFVGDKKVYGYVAAASRQAFEDHGMNFGIFGMDIMSDIEQGGKLVPSDFASSAMGMRREIMQKINAANVGLNLTNEATMMRDIDAWAKQFNPKNSSSKTPFNTTAINESIANGGSLHRVSQAFDSVAEKYMKEIGIIGELVRYPTFRSQFASRFVLSDHVSGNQVVMFNPVASSITNVDFDGDLMYSIFKFNGGSGLLAKNTMQLQRRVYENVIQSIPELLAELVRDGEAYDYQDPNNTTAQMADILKKMHRDKYEALQAEYMKKHGYTSPTKAQTFAFITSQEMRDAYLDLEYNTLFDIRSQKASIAPVFRKENIGYVSTTNFNARNMLQAVIEDYQKAGNAESYNKAVDILNAVTNPKSAKGGIFDMAEQLAIDTKHVWDAMTTAETARYSTGMNLLFGKHALPKAGRSLEDQQRAAVEHLVSSLYNSVFKQTHDGLEVNRKQNIRGIVDEIMAHKGDWRTAEFKLDAAPKRGIAALLELQELDMPNNLSNLRKYFTSSFNRGNDPGLGDRVYMMEDVSDLMEMYKAMNKTQIDINPAFLNSQTYYDGLAKFIQKSISDRSLQTHSGISYAMPSSLKGLTDKKLVGEDLVFTLRDHHYSKDKSVATFDVFKVNNKKGSLVKVNAEDYADVLPKGVGMKIQDGGLRFTAKWTGALNETLFGEKGYFAGATQIAGVPIIKNNANEAHDAFAKIRHAKIAQSINDVVINPSGSLASANTIVNNIQYVQSMSKENIAKFGQYEYDAVSKLFSQPGVDIRKVANRTSDLMRTYEYAASTGQIRSQVSTNALLTSINNDIAAHPERYKAKPDDNFTQTFDKILEQRFISDKIFSSIEQIEAMRKAMVQLGDFDIESYNKVVQNLRSSIYDVQREEEVLRKQYKQFLSSNPYGQTEVAQAAQAALDETIDKFKSQVQVLNQKQVDVAQSQIYAMFKDRKQMESFFGWNDITSAGSQKVGFGTHIGQNFSSLSRSEAFKVIESARAVLDSTTASRDAKYAAEQTSIRLSNYSRDVGIPNLGSNVQFNQENSKVLEDALKEVDILQKSAKMEIDAAKDAANELFEKSGLKNAVENAGTETANAGTQAAKGTRKTLLGELASKGKSFMQDAGITGKHVGTVVAGLAAIGVVNNLLHRQKSGSPLMPGHKPNGKGSPSIDGYYPDAPEESRAPATAGTGPKTVYQSNGLNFRVSASTARHANARQQAAQMSAVTGGSTNISVQQDTSKVSNNWLSDKFADLV